MVLFFHLTAHNPAVIQIVFQCQATSDIVRLIASCKWFSISIVYHPADNGLINPLASHWVLNRLMFYLGISMSHSHWLTAIFPGCYCFHRCNPLDNWFALQTRRESWFTPNLAQCDAMLNTYCLTHTTNLELTFMVFVGKRSVWCY